jgi:hypothetical protein
MRAWLQPHGRTLTGNIWPAATRFDIVVPGPRRSACFCDRCGTTKRRERGSTPLIPPVD